MYFDGDECEIEELVGKTFSRVYTADSKNIDLKSFWECIQFFEDNKLTYVLKHQQDCCECVYIEDICGDLSDLEGSPITFAERVSKEALPDDFDDSETWTFFKIGTCKGSVTIRFYGTSNGYYSEDARLYKAGKDE